MASLDSCFSEGENYSCAGLKTTLHGIDYQLKLLMLFLLRGANTKKQFKLSTEDTAFGKFDDIVYEQENDYLLVQAKHRLDSTKKIKTDDLFPNNQNDDDFSLCKYLNSFLNIKKKLDKNAKFKCIVCTNIGLELESKYIELEHIPNDNLKFFHCERLRDKTPIFYQFQSTNFLINKLHDSIAKELVEHLCSSFNERKFTLHTEIMKKFHKAMLNEKLIEVYKSKFFLNWTFLQENNDYLDCFKTTLQEYLQEVNDETNQITLEKLCEMKTDISVAFGSNDENQKPLNLDESIKPMIKEIVQIILRKKKITECNSTIKPYAKDLVDKKLIKKLANKCKFKKEFFETETNRYYKDLFINQLKNFTIDDLCSETNLIGIPENFGETTIDEEKELPKKLDTNDITDFLGNLVFAVDQPDEEELVKIIKLEIGRQYPNKDVDTIYCYLLIGVLNWFKKYSDKRSTYLTDKTLKKFSDFISKKLTSYTSEE